eukprot:403357549
MIGYAAELGYKNTVLFCVLFSINGFLQSIGWPACSAIFGNWFGKRGRGILIGLFCSAGNAGNIGGALMTSFLTSTLLYNWRISFIIVSSFCTLAAILNFLFLVVHPQEKGMSIEEYDEKLNETERVLLLEMQQDPTESFLYRQEREGRQYEKGINFWSALQIPGVLAYSLSYFCLKFSSYGLLFWLPMFLQKMNGYTDYETASCVSMLDIGYVIGGVIIGYVSDLMYCRRVPVAVFSIVIATLLHIILVYLDAKMKIWFFFHIFLLGMLMGGAIAIVSGISCTDLGKMKELKSSEKSVATVTGIIDGIGSFGAAIGQILIGVCEQYFGWNSVFLMMSVMVFLGAAPLLRSFKREMKEVITLFKIHARRKNDNSDQDYNQTQTYKSL